MQKSMIEFWRRTFLPYLRMTKDWSLFLQAKFKLRRAKLLKATSPVNTAFIIGCGRSGTTILGEMLSLHPGVCYLLEPLHLWTALNSVFDVNQRYHDAKARVMMDALSVNLIRQADLNALFYSICPLEKKVVVEKTPHNAMRIGFLENSLLNPKFIHIVRNGLDVSASIADIAQQNRRRIELKGYNQWWGRNYAKWQALKLEGAEAGYFSTEVDCLGTDLQKAAYEWLVSIAEVDRWKTILVDRIFELTYDDLVSEPFTLMGMICEFIGLDVDKNIITNAIKLVKRIPKKRRYSLFLPHLMCQRFNSYQERYNFDGRANLLNQRRL